MCMRVAESAWVEERVIQIRCKSLLFSFVFLFFLAGFLRCSVVVSGRERSKVRLTVPGTEINVERDGVEEHRVHVSRSRD